MSSSELLFAKGADVASATSISLGTDGNFFDITGTTNIETITIKQAGTVVWLHFDGALSLVDNTGNLELRGSNLAVSAEDIVGLVSDGTNWNLIAYDGLATDLNITSQAQGDILYFDGSNWVRLAKGTAGQQLTMNSGATAPEWAKKATFGSWASGTFNSSTQVSSDGFVVCVANHRGNNADLGDTLSIKTDSSNPPTTVRSSCVIEAAVSGVTGGKVSVMTPIKSGDYYLAEDTTDGFESEVVYFIPLS